MVSATSSEISVGRFFGQAFEANRLIIGPAVEFRTTPKVAIEFDVLFQSADLRGAGAGAAIFPRSSWQADTSLRYFPVLAKYRLRKHNFTPFTVGGGAFRHYSHSGNISTTTVGSSGMPGSTTSPLKEGHTDAGWAVGGGLEFKVKLLRISPEIRYMRFSDLACDRCANTAQPSSLTHNPVTMMLGLGF